MFTIKIQSPGEGYEVISSRGDVSIYKPGDGEYEAIYGPCRDGHQQAEEPRAILRFEREDCGSAKMLYDDDRAWIMNANGKTVATV